MRLKILLILIFPAFFFSCMTPPKNILYFQDLDKYSQNIQVESDLKANDPVIKRNDELLITVAAPVLNQEKVMQFNLPPVSAITSGDRVVDKQASVQTYIVNQDGNINFPVIGNITLAGLTKSQAVERIKKSISNYVENPIIILKILSFRVIILGEVRVPGPVYSSQEKMSILDAIGAAGDLTIYGNRKNILLLRENDNGAIDHVRFDLTSSDLFKSPYFYLQQNDKIIVEPNRTRQLDGKFGAADGYRLSVISMVIGVLSIITSTTIAIVSLRKN